MKSEQTAKEKAWIWEKERHLGDYGDSSEYDLECAFKAGWESGNRNKQKQHEAEMDLLISSDDLTEPLKKQHEAKIKEIRDKLKEKVRAAHLGIVLKWIDEEFDKLTRGDETTRKQLS